MKSGSPGKGRRKHEARRVEVRVREWKHSSYGERTSVGKESEIGKLWERVMKI